MEMVLALAASVTLSGQVVYLECRAEDAPSAILVALSLSPQLVHVETRGPNSRTSTLGVGETTSEWWWDDWGDDVLGRSRINRQTLAYKVERGDRRANGSCRKLTADQWTERL
jgi:hypothetical protein